MSSKPTETRSTASLWMATSTTQVRPPLEEDAQADVCVVGAGIAGMTTAYLLAREGRSVIVLDDGPIGGGQTSLSTAHLSNAIDDRYVEIERLHGAKGSRLAARSHTAAIERIDSIVASERIDCGFERVDGYLFAAEGTADGILEREMKAAHRAGLVDVELVSPPPSVSLGVGPRCLRFPRQGQLHPLKYLTGLARGIEREGGRIHTGTRATKVEGGAGARVETSGGKVVSTKAIVVATNSPINDRLTIHTKQAPYTTYVIGARLPHGSVPKALYWDTLESYHYVRVHSAATGNGNSYDVLVVGGEDHKTAQSEDGAGRLARLETWTRERFPMIGGIEYRWSGQVMETIDGLAFIGRNPLDDDNVYVATGDSGMGMTHGTIAGILITELIVKHASEWAALYEPSRKTLRATGTFLGENINVAAQYAEHLTGGDVVSAQELAPGEGAVIRRGLHKVAVYRDAAGVLHERSALCPHLGCVVAFNDVEKSWDCPCHGSRFDSLGYVMNGPANADLAPVEE